MVLLRGKLKMTERTKVIFLRLFRTKTKQSLIIY